MTPVRVDTYARELGEAVTVGIQTMVEPPGCEQPAHLFWLMMPTAADQGG